MKGSEDLNENERTETGLLRYKIISWVLQSVDAEHSQKDLCLTAAARSYERSDGSSFTVSSWTIERWIRAYKKDGFNALLPKERDDAGIQRKMTPEIKTAVIAKVKDFPAMPATVIYRSLIEEGVLTQDDASLSTVTRFVAKARKDLDSLQLIPPRERRRYEKPHINMVWYGDSTYSVYLADENGIRRQVYIIALIDDASRLITSCQAFFHDNTENLFQVIEIGIRRYGKPELFSFDNGKNYRNQQTALLAARAGIAINYAPPYTPQSKGKIERFFGTLKEQWQSALKPSEMESLETLQKSLDKYVHQYNSTVHSALGMAPQERFFQEAQLIHYIPEDTMNDLFLYENDRKVSADGVIKLEGLEFEVDYRFSRSRVKIRYKSDLSEVFVQEDGKKYKARLLNKVENSDMHRHTVRFSGPVMNEEE